MTYDVTITLKIFSMGGRSYTEKFVSIGYVVAEKRNVKKKSKKTKKGVEE